MYFDVFQTLAVACFVLLFGFFASKRIGWIQTFNIPEPVVGGFVAAVLCSIAFVFFETTFNFDIQLQSAMMIVFFSSIGLGADFSQLKRGGRPLILFVVITGVFIVMQNGFGILLANIFGLDLSYGLIAGSITLTGGHGTGAAWAPQLIQSFGIESATELAMACATYGLVAGGIIGGPVAKFLLRKNKVKFETPFKDEVEVVRESDKFSYRKITSHNMVETLAMFGCCFVIGSFLTIELKGSHFEMPNFVWSLFTGVLIRNVLTKTTAYVVNDHAVQILGSTGLSLFLAIALMSLKLWELSGMAFQVLLILFFQTVLLVLFAILVTYRVMGKNYDAVVMAAGHCGFGLGATPTAVANMQAITNSYGPSVKAFLIVPMVGAFFVDLINNVCIKFFISILS